MSVETHVPIEKFGKDHWSTFAYAETVCVDHRGVPDRRRMRCDTDRHPGLAPYPSPEISQKYPTRLKGGELLADHDDWDCIDDCEVAGLLEQLGSGIHPFWRLTDKGKEVAGQLRAHKADGKGFATFELEVQCSNYRSKTTLPSSR